MPAPVVGLSRKAILDRSTPPCPARTDYIDVYAIHRFDADTPVEETMERSTTRQRGQGALPRRLVDVRLAVRGAANGAHRQRADALRLDGEPVQPAEARRGTRADPHVRGHRRGLVPYSPNGKDVWPGRGAQSHRSTIDDVVKAFDSPLDAPVIDAVEEIARAAHPDGAGRSAWVLRHPGSQPHHRRHQTSPPLRSDSRAGRAPHRRRDHRARSALHPPRAVLVLVGPQPIPELRPPLLRARTRERPSARATPSASDLEARGSMPR